MGGKVSVVPTDVAGWVAVTLVTVLATARVTKLLTEDSWPPAAWLRDRWWGLFAEDSAWRELFVCPFCMAPYVAAAVMAAGWFSDGNIVWWAVCGWLSVSYVAAMVVARDIPPES